jgi:hypothetical protein
MPSTTTSLQTFCRAPFCSESVTPATNSVGFSESLTVSPLLAARLARGALPLTLLLPPPQDGAAEVESAQDVEHNPVRASRKLHATRHAAWLLVTQSLQPKPLEKAVTA